jgi:hypothetical protein
MKWLLSTDKKYLYAEHNPTIKADLQGNVYGGGLDPVTGSIVAAVAGAGASALFSGDGGGGSSQSTTTQTDPYKEAMMKIFLPEYQKLAPQMSGLLQNKISGTGLPEDLAQTIGRYYNQAGEKYGNYFASNNMLNSGSAQQAFQGLTQEEIQTKLATILGQQREGLGQAMDFMGMGDSAGGTETTNKTVTPPIDWTGIGSLLNKMNFNSPSAIPLRATGYGGGSWGSSTPYNAIGLTGYGNWTDYMPQTNSPWQATMV